MLEYILANTNVYAGIYLYLKLIHGRYNKTAITIILCFAFTLPVPGLKFALGNLRLPIPSTSLKFLSFCCGNAKEYVKSQRAVPRQH